MELCETPATARVVPKVELDAGAEAATLQASTKDTPMILLKSVGCFYNPKDGMTYPAFANGKPDLRNGTHLDDIDNGEWHDALSEEDERTVFGA